MRAVFDKGELLVLLQDFYVLTGIRTVVFDAWGVDILSYPGELPAFCRMVRQAPQGETACLLCDQNACRRAQREKKTILYPCHAGLIEVITPILVEDATVGYLLLSHIVQGADGEAEWAAVQQRCSGYPLDFAALHAAFGALPRTPYTTLRSAADLLSLAARAIYLDRLARLAPGSMQDALSRYLSEHLTEPLSSERLCREFSISRTALYHLAKETYGRGIAEHIALLRIQRAIQLLTTTRLSTAEICRQVGFADPNYFFRVFKRQTGLTPKMYRNQFQALP
ncbi:MAG: PocR ligand-binding domain-containing protein [Gemmiger sp.]|nr:PocR ligand-binding domain-containing protein [Gemmiger sp.]